MPAGWQSIRSTREIHTMIDRAVVYLQAGRGGNGCESFENRGPRKYYPQGGDGGKGGDIIFRADANSRDLEYFKFNPHLRAESGTQGSSNKKTGKSGKDLILKVPPGTIVLHKDKGYIIRNLSAVHDEFIAVRGGWPGRGNHDNKTPSHGKDGETFECILDYQIPSDIALIGPPNAGKTLLLSHLTRAKVTATEYPFSTTTPQLGSLELEDYTRFILCDLPSLIKGAAHGKGVGSAFLKHALRAKLLYILLDPTSEFTEGIIDAYQMLAEELRTFSSELCQKPHIVLINKCDMAVDEKIKKDKETLKKTCKEVYNISAKTGEGIDTVIQRTQELLQ